MILEPTSFRIKSYMCLLSTFKYIICVSTDLNAIDPQDLIVNYTPNLWLVGGLEHFLLFHSVRIDERGVATPQKKSPTDGISDGHERCCTEFTTHASWPTAWPSVGPSADQCCTAFRVPAVGWGPATVPELHGRRQEIGLDMLGCMKDLGKSRKSHHKYHE